MNKDIINTMDVRKRNRSKVMSHIIKKITATKIELQKETGFSYSTIGNILIDLLDGGYISETERAPSTGGRKPKTVSLNYGDYLFLSIDLSNHNFHWAIYDLRAVIIIDQYYTYNYEISFKTNMERFADWINNVCQKKNLDFKKVSGIGIATPGYYRETNDRIFHSSYKDLETIKIKNFFYNKFKIPVLIMNDANTAAYNEISSYNYSKSKCIFYLLITKDGVGSAIAIEGEIFTGAKGYAGESHVIHIEYNGQIKSMGDWLYPESDLKYLSARLGYSVTETQFFDLFRDKNQYAMEIYTKIVYTLSSGLFQVFNILNPSDLLISGFYNGYGDQMVQDLLKILKEKTQEYQIEGLKISLSHFTDKTILSGIGKKLINQWCNNI